MIPLIYEYKIEICDGVNLVYHELIKALLSGDAVLLKYNNATHISFPFVFDHQEDLVQLIQLSLWVPWFGVDRDQHYILQHCNRKQSRKPQNAHLSENMSHHDMCGCTQKKLTNLIN